MSRDELISKLYEAAERKMSGCQTSSRTTAMVSYKDSVALCSSAVALHYVLLHTGRLVIKSNRKCFVVYVRLHENNPGSMTDAAKMHDGKPKSN